MLDACVGFSDSHYSLPLEREFNATPLVENFPRLRSFEKIIIYCSFSLQLVLPIAIEYYLSRGGQQIALTNLRITSILRSFASYFNMETLGNALPRDVWENILKLLRLQTRGKEHYEDTYEVIDTNAIPRTGSFGRVTKVRCREEGTEYAIKRVIVSRESNQLIHNMFLQILQECALPQLIGSHANLVSAHPHLNWIVLPERVDAMDVMKMLDQGADLPLSHLKLFIGMLSCVCVLTTSKFSVHSPPSGLYFIVACFIAVYIVYRDYMVFDCFTRYRGIHGVRLVPRRPWAVASMSRGCMY